MIDDAELIGMVEQDVTPYYRAKELTADQVGLLHEVVKQNPINVDLALRAIYFAAFSGHEESIRIVEKGIESAHEQVRLASVGAAHSLLMIIQRNPDQVFKERASTRLLAIGKRAIVDGNATIRTFAEDIFKCN